MDIINIDAETFEAMLSKFESFAGRMEALCRLHGDRDDLLHVFWFVIGLVADLGICQRSVIPKRLQCPFGYVQELAYILIIQPSFYIPVVEEKLEQAKYKGKQL